MERKVEKIVLTNPKAVEFFKECDKRKEDLREKLKQKYIDKGILKPDTK